MSVNLLSDAKVDSQNEGYWREYIEMPDARVTSTDHKLRLMQWNVLAQGFVPLDEFVHCSASLLTLESRCMQIAREINHFNPDVMCLQEVDLLPHLLERLNQSNPNQTNVYEKVFAPKLSSPCLNVPGNIGPDGVAIVYRSDRFELIQSELLPLDEQSDRSAVLCHFRPISPSTPPRQSFCVVSVHLKAKLEFEKVRQSQANHLIDSLLQLASKLSAASLTEGPLFVCGDFNAESEEAAIEVMLSRCGECIPDWQLFSAYAQSHGGGGGGGAEPEFTTWKIRDSPRLKKPQHSCHTIDYIFYSQRLTQLQGVWSIPTRDVIGPHGLPSANFPSDHMNLIADFVIR